MSNELEPKMTFHILSVTIDIASIAIVLLIAAAIHERTGAPIRAAVHRITGRSSHGDDGSEIPPADPEERP